MNDLWIELAMDEEETQKNGMVLIIDLGGFPMRLFKFLSPKATIISALKEEVKLHCKLPNFDWISHSFTHSLIHSLIHSLTISLTHSLTHSMTLQSALHLIKVGPLLDTKL
jgi:hypothetical protein